MPPRPLYREGWGGSFLRVYTVVMADATVKFDPKDLLGEISEIEKTLMPRAAYNSLHKAVYEAAQRIKDEARVNFRNPVPYTISAFRYDKPEAVGDTLVAAVYISEDGSKGNAPVDYLDPVMTGGKAFPTRFQRMLRRLPDRSSDPNTDALGNQGTILRRGQIMAPAMRSSRVRKNKWGNMSGGQYTEILTHLAGGVSSADVSDFDKLNMRMEARRLKRAKQNERRANRGLKPLKTDRYFYMNPNMASLRNLKNPKAGIFLKTKTGRLHRIMTQIDENSMPLKFHFDYYADDTVRSVFLAELHRHLNRRYP